MEKWRESLTQKLDDLDEKLNDFHLENLFKNELFITTVIQASHIAMRNHQKEKIEALRNAILNTAIMPSPEEDLQLIFLNYIEILTPLHLRMLKYYNNKKEFMEKRGIDIGSTHDHWSPAFPEFKGKWEFSGIIISDLEDRRLIISGDEMMNRMMRKEDTNKLTTEIGDQFLQFITSPIETE